ncbi:MAG: hypothetical protein AAGP08_04265, partial [Pseudomonadota bacterium]
MTAVAVADCHVFSKDRPIDFQGTSYQFEDGSGLLLEIASLVTLENDTDPNAINVSRDPTGKHGFNGPDKVEVKDGECFGPTSALYLENAVAWFRIGKGNSVPSKVILNFCDYGGYENFSADLIVNDQFIGEITDLPVKLPNYERNDVFLRIAEDVHSGWSAGTIVMEEPKRGVEEFLFGGQNVAISAVCIEYGDE